MSSQMLVDPRDDGRAAAGGDALRAARRRHRDHHRAADRVQPRDRRAPASARRAASGRSSSTWRGASIPIARTSSSFAVGPTRSATRSPASCRCTPASRRSRETGDAVQWGGSRLCDGWSVPDARRPGALHAGRAPATSASSPRDSSVLSTRRGKQFNTMVHAERDPLTGADARRAVHGAERRRRARRSPTERRWSCAPSTASSRRACTSRRSRPATCRCSSPRATCCCRPGRRDPASGVPDYNTTRHGRAAVTAPPPTQLLEVFERRGRRAARRARATHRRRTAGPDRAPGPVPPRHRRRRRRSCPCCTTPGSRVLSEESGWTGDPDVADHRGARSGRRLHQLRAQHPVLGDLGVRARRRRHAGRIRRERRDRSGRYTAVRGEGAWLDDERLTASADDAKSSARSSRSSGLPRARVAVAAVPRAGLVRARAVRRRRGQRRRLPRRVRQRSPPVGLPRRLARVPRGGRRVVDVHGRELVVAEERRAASCSRRAPPELLDAAAWPGSPVTMDASRSRPRSAAPACRPGSRRPRARDRARGAFGGRAQRAREGARRLGERRRHRERAASCARRSRVVARTSRSSARRAAVSGATSDGSSIRSTAPRTSCTGSPWSACRSAWSRTASRWSASSTRRCSATPTRRDAAAARSATACRIRVSDAARGEAISATGFPFRAKRERSTTYLPVFERALRTLRGPPAGRGGEPRPGVDRGGRVRRLLRARPRHLGRRRRRVARPRGGRRGHRLGGRRPGLARVGRHRRRPARACTPAILELTTM